MPALCGAILGWWQFGLFQSLAFVFQISSVLTLALGMNALYEYCDYKHAHKAASAGEITLPCAAQKAPQPVLLHEPRTTGYGLMVGQLLSPEIALALGYWMLMISVLCSLWLTLLVGWPVLFFSGLSLVLA